MPRRRSNQAKWMRNPRNVNWVLAELKYENVPLQKRYFKGDGFLDGSNYPRGVVLDKLEDIKKSNTLEGIRRRYEQRLRGLFRGEKEGGKW